MLSLPESGVPGDAVAREIAALRAGDHSYADGTVFNSLCADPLPIASSVFARHLSANLGDDRIFPGLRQAEDRVTEMLGELLGGPKARGVLVSGGTEANLLAVASALLAFRARRPGVRAQLLAPESIHFSVEKIAMLLDVELVKTRLDARMRMDPADLRKHLCDCTALILVTAGTSECGAVDDVAAAAELARQSGVPLHVDAATGGFLVPFASQLGHQLPAFDFSIPEVASIALDPHKYGGAPVPAGYLLVRDRETLERLRVRSHYRGTSDHYSLLGTRPGASVLAVYAALRSMGRTGYRRQASELFRLRDHLVRLLKEQGFALAYPPDLTVIGVLVPAPAHALARLEEQGLIASMSRRHPFLRLVIHRHLTTAHVESLVRQLVEIRRGGLA